MSATKFHYLLTWKRGSWDNKLMLNGGRNGSKSRLAAENSAASEMSFIRRRLWTSYKPGTEPENNVQVTVSIFFGTIQEFDAEMLRVSLETGAYINVPPTRNALEKLA